MTAPDWFIPNALPIAVTVPLLLSLGVPALGATIVLARQGQRRSSLVTTLAARGALLVGIGFTLIASVATLSVLGTGLAELHNRHQREVVTLAEQLKEFTGGTAEPAQAAMQPRLALFLAARNDVGMVGLRWFDCPTGCVQLHGDSAVAASATAWMERRRGQQVAEEGTLLTFDQHPYLLVGSAVRDPSGRPLGELVAAIDAADVVDRAARTAWLLVALASVLLVVAVVSARLILAASVSGRVRDLIARLERADPLATRAPLPITPADELGVLADSVQAHIERSLDRERESDRRFQRLVDASPDAIFVAVDAGIVYVNAAALRLLRAVRADDLVGRRLSDFLEVAPEAGHDGGAPALREGLLLRADGSRTDVEVAMLAFTYAGEAAVQTTVRDISARKAAEAAQRRTEQVYRALVEHAAHGMYRADPAHRFVTVNPALVRMLGSGSADELLAADASADLFVDPAQRAALVTRFRQHDRLEDFEVEWRRRDGRPITVKLSGQRVTADDGTLLGVEMTAEDVTERRALEAQLRQAQKMEAVGQLTGGVAHDFNNLLTVILTNAELVAHSLPPEAETARADLGELRQAARRGAALVHKLLAFSRADRLERREVRVGPLLSDTAFMLRRVLPENIEVVLPAEAPAEPILADPVAIEQILLNLATNARDAMPGGGRLELHAAGIDVDAARAQAHEGVSAGRFLRLSVRDTGHGMDEPTRAHVFEPFFTTKPVGAGTGLGMAMVYGLVRHHHGFIELESAPGRGTTVSIHLPLIDAASRATEPPAEQAPAAPATQGETILVVEDEEPIRRATTRVLQRAGYRVLLAGDGLEGLEIARAHRDTIDLVVSDLMMPRMGGKAFFDAMRAEGNRTPFLFISGYTQESQEVFRSLSDHAAYLNKPWEMNELLGRIRQLLGRTSPTDA